MSKQRNYEFLNTKISDILSIEDGILKVDYGVEDLFAYRDTPSFVDLQKMEVSYDPIIKNMYSLLEERVKVWVINCVKYQDSNDEGREILKPDVIFKECHYFKTGYGKDNNSGKSRDKKVEQVVLQVGSFFKGIEAVPYSTQTYQEIIKDKVFKDFGPDSCSDLFIWLIKEEMIKWHIQAVDKLVKEGKLDIKFINPLDETKLITYKYVNRNGNNRIMNLYLMPEEILTPITEFKKQNSRFIYAFNELSKMDSTYGAIIQWGSDKIRNTDWREKIGLLTINQKELLLEKYALYSPDIKKQTDKQIKFMEKNIKLKEKFNVHHLENKAVSELWVNSQTTPLALKYSEILLENNLSQYVKSFRNHYYYVSNNKLSIRDLDKYQVIDIKDVGSAWLVPIESMWSFDYLDDIINSKLVSSIIFVTNSSTHTEGRTRSREKLQDSIMEWMHQKIKVDTIKCYSWDMKQVISLNKEEIDSHSLIEYKKTLMGIFPKTMDGEILKIN